MDLVINKKEIENWLTGLKKSFKVVRTEKSVLPAKQYFFPPRQDTFIYEKKSGKLSALGSEKKLLIVSPYLSELEAITQLDEIMEKPKRDFFYWQKRKNSVLVGIIEYSVDVSPGGDLILEKVNQNQYRALVLTEKGKKLVKKNFFREVKDLKVKRYEKEKKEFKEMLLDPELLSDAVEWSWQNGHRIWDKLGKKCLGCGICTYVCPICHCFSIEDRVELDDNECVRCRYWDACTLPKFSRVSGGHNFHPTIKERYYNWFYHKFVRAYRQYGRSQCVGCGQCGENCPAGIKIGEVLKEIVKDYKNR